jgi:L-ascorbate metabolism protein UlaG (beta-lactamase superfamily)
VPLIVPALQDDALLADVRAANVRDGGFRVWWLGQSGFLVQFEGAHLLFDPYLSDSLTRKYADTDKPHTRMTERVVDPARLDFIDVVTSSHNHTDHLDAETLLPLRAANANLTLVIPEANRAFVANRLGCDAGWPRGLAVGEACEVGPFTLHCVPAAHEDLSPECVGYVARFGRWSVYHAGDTLRYEGMAETLRSFHLDLALLPINGRAPERRVAGNLNAREAVELAHAAGIRHVIPCHYDMFAFNTTDPREFAREAAAAGQGFTVLRQGERWASVAISGNQP